MFSMLRTTMRFQKPVKVRFAVRGARRLEGLDLLDARTCEMRPALPDNRRTAGMGCICVGPDPGGGVANGAR
jgi:hypothetical protein